MPRVWEKCYCGVPGKLWRARTGFNAGRRFFKCPGKGERGGEGCGFFEFEALDWEGGWDWYDDYDDGFGDGFGDVGSEDDGWGEGDSDNDDGEDYDDEYDDDDGDDEMDQTRAFPVATGVVENLLDQYEAALLKGWVDEEEKESDSDGEGDEEEEEEKEEEEEEGEPDD
jgi:hypothetical protein